MSERPSRMSNVTTVMRALGHEGLSEVRDFSDPTAMPMLSWPWRLTAKLWIRRLRRRATRDFDDGRFDLIPLRTRYIDDQWAAAHAAGIRQLVLLGAGLDGRAYRLPNVADTVVFEVDQAATQEQKRQRAQSLRVLAGRQVFVPMNFERDALDEKLAAAGLARDKPTLWNWEGVTPYLTPAAQQATLTAMVRSSGPGSRIVMTYTVPQTNAAGTSMARMVRFFGEPFRGRLNPAEAATLITEAGLRLVEDTGIEDWRRRYSNNPRPSSFQERIAVAERK